MNARIETPDDVPHVSTVRGISMTEYRLTGTLEAVQKMIAVLFNQYHPAGYGTRVHHIEYQDGNYSARISRANSCE